MPREEIKSVTFNRKDTTMESQQKQVQDHHALSTLANSLSSQRRATELRAAMILVGLASNLLPQHISYSHSYRHTADSFTSCGPQPPAKKSATTKLSN